MLYNKQEMIQKSLKFNHIEAENIIAGLQTATLRINDDKNLSVNDVFYVIDKVKESDARSWQIIGEAAINKITSQRAGDLDLNGHHFERFGSMTELYKQFAIFYGDPIDDNTLVKVIYFTFHKYDKNKQFEQKDVSNTTYITEVKLFGDGGSRGNPGPSASGYVIKDMSDKILESNGEYLNITTNNQAEYHSLKIGLERAQQLGAKKVHIFMDSLLVVNQIKGLFKVRNRELQAVYIRVKNLMAEFEYTDITHVPRELNKLADAEVNRILDSISK